MQQQQQQQLYFSIPTLVRGSVLSTILNNIFKYVSFIRYSNEKSELKAHN